MHRSRRLLNVPRQVWRKKRSSEPWRPASPSSSASPALLARRVVRESWVRIEARFGCNGTWRVPAASARIHDKIRDARYKSTETYSYFTCLGSFVPFEATFSFCLAVRAPLLSLVGRESNKPACKTPYTVARVHGTLHVSREYFLRVNAERFLKKFPAAFTSLCFVGNGLLFSVALTSNHVYHSLQQLRCLAWYRIWSGLGCCRKRGWILRSYCRYRYVRKFSILVVQVVEIKII